MIFSENPLTKRHRQVVERGGGTAITGCGTPFRPVPAEFGTGIQSACYGVNYILTIEVIKITDHKPSSVSSSLGELINK